MRRRNNYAWMYYASLQEKENKNKEYEEHMLEKLNVYKIIQQKINILNTHYGQEEYKIIKIYDTLDEQLNYRRLTSYSKGNYIKKRIEIADLRLKKCILEVTQNLLSEDKEKAERYNKEAEDLVKMYADAYDDIKYLQRRQNVRDGFFGICLLFFPVSFIIALVLGGITVIITILAYLLLSIIQVKTDKKNGFYCGKVNEKMFNQYFQRKADNTNEFSEKYRNKRQK